MRSLRFALLGPVKVYVDDRPLPIGGPRAQAVIAALLLEAGSVLPLARLMQAAWGDYPPDSARIQAQNRISALRRTLRDAGVEDVITTVGSGYRIKVPAGSLDVDQFQAGVGRANREVSNGELDRAAQTLNAALGLWRGEALAGLTTPRLRAAAHRLEEARLNARELLIEVELRRGRHHSLIPELNELAELHPWRERLVGQLMIALYRDGRRHDALAAFERTRDRLVTELGMDPGPALIAVRDQVLRDAPELSSDPSAGSGPAAIIANAKPPAGPSRCARRTGIERPDVEAAGTETASVPPVPRQLPLAVRLVGREAELAGLVEALSRRQDGWGPAVVAIHGPGGVGKSALAIAAAHRVATSYPGGQLYVDLQGANAGLAPLALADVVGRFLRALGVAAAQVPAAEAEAVALYRTLMAERRILIVADNAGSLEQVTPLLPPTPGSAMIVTSRQVLGMLDGAVRIDLKPLPAIYAAALLTSIVGAGRADPESESAAIATIVQACGGLPLALRIAGARLLSCPDWTMSDLARRLADERRVLHELNATDETLRASLQVSWRELNTDRNPVDALAARIFLALGAILVRTLEPNLAAALCETTPELAEMALDRLATVWLINVDGGRYWLHDLLRLYAAELAAGDHTRHTLLRKALSWYTSAAREVLRLMRGAVRPSDQEEERVLVGVTDAASAGMWLDRQLDNIVALVRQAIAESPTMSRLGGELVLALYPAILMRGHRYEWELLCRSVLEAADHIGDPKIIAYVWTRLSVMLSIQLRTAEALECLEHALPLHRLSGDRSGEAAAIEAAGMALNRLGRAEEALLRFEAAIRLRADLGDRHGTGITLNNMAEAYRCLGRHDEALQHLQRSLEIRREVGDVAGESITLHTLAEVHAELGRLADALRIADAAIECSRRAGERENERRSLELRALIRIRTGNIAAAVADCRDVLALAGPGDSPADLTEFIAALESSGQQVLAEHVRCRRLMA